MADAFEKYAKFGKTEKQVGEMKGNLRIETRNVQKMMKETGVIDAKYSSNLLDNDIMRVIGKLSTSHASKYPKGTKTLEKEGFEILLAQIAESKKTEVETIKAKIESSAGPSTAGTTGVANKESVAKMTNVENYTGAHKERFNADGSGKGAEGRTDKVDNSGYVGNYKNKDTYDSKH